jgi:hypothetical protein
MTRWPFHIFVYFTSFNHCLKLIPGELTEVRYINNIIPWRDENTGPGGVCIRAKLAWSTPAHLDNELLNIGIITGTWLLFVPLLILLQRHFGIPDFIFHLLRSFSTSNTKLKFISNFKFQYCTLSQSILQHKVRRILHTKIGPVSCCIFCVLLCF